MRPLTNLTSTNLYYLIFALLVASLISIFERPTDHRNLHSFPTRRSSDLALQDCAGRAEGCCDRHDAGHTERRMARSEEHTSELQSLRHLVCRLLLEKKKNERVLFGIV